MIFENSIPEATVPNKDLTCVVLARVDEFADKPALIDGLSSRTLTFAELRTQINHFAAG